jgi:hypothetical protein
LQPEEQPGAGSHRYSLVSSSLAGQAQAPISRSRALELAGAVEHEARRWHGLPLPVTTGGRAPPAARHLPFHLVPFTSHDTNLVAKHTDLGAVAADQAGAPMQQPGRANLLLANAASRHGQGCGLHEPPWTEMHPDTRAR